MQHLKVSGAVRPLKWPLGVKWLIEFQEHSLHVTLLMTIAYLYTPF